MKDETFSNGAGIAAGTAIVLRAAGLNAYTADILATSSTSGGSSGNGWVSAAALAQSVSLPNLTGGDSSEQSEVSNEDFQRSLGNVISMLENEEPASFSDVPGSACSTSSGGAPVGLPLSALCPVPCPTLFFFLSPRQVKAVFRSATY